MFAPRNCGSLRFLRCARARITKIVAVS